jgi:chromosome partitioning protein
VRGRETFDRTWAEVKEVLLGTWWRDLQMAQAQETGDGEKT